MKAKKKSSRKVAKKSVAKKSISSTNRKKKTAKKTVKKVVAVKKTRKAKSGKTTKKTTSKKESISKTSKKKIALKPVKKSVTKATKVTELEPMIIMEEVVTVTTTLPGNGAPSIVAPGVLVGKVTHFYNLSSVAIIELEAGNLHLGDTIHIKGHTTDFEQVVESMEIEHQNIEFAEMGQSVGVKVRDVVREQDKVYKIEGAL